MHHIRLAIGSQISQGWLTYDEQYICKYDNRYYLMQFNYPSLDLTNQRVKPTSEINNITKNVLDLIVLQLAKFFKKNIKTLY